MHRKAIHTVSRAIRPALLPLCLTSTVLLSTSLANATAAQQPSAQPAPPPAVLDPVFSSSGDDRTLLLIDGAVVDPDAAEKRKKAEELHEQGWQLSLQRKWAQAIKLYQQALDISERKSTRLNLAEAFFHMEDFPSAVSHYRAAAYIYDGDKNGEGGSHAADVTSKPKRLIINDPGKLMRFAIALNRTGHSDEAVAIYNEGFRRLDQRGWYLPLTVVFDGKNRERIYSPARLEAVAKTALAILEGPEDPLRRKDVLAYLDDAIRLQPHLAAAHFYRGVALGSVAGHRAEAAAAYSRAIALGHGNVKAAVEKAGLPGF